MRFNQSTGALRVDIGAATVAQQEMDAKGYSQIDGLSTSKGLGTAPAESTQAIVTPEGANVRYRVDGTVPTATVGMPLNVGEELIVSGEDLTSIRFIEQTASAKLNVTFFGPAA